MHNFMQKLKSLHLRYDTVFDNIGVNRQYTLYLLSYTSVPVNGFDYFCKFRVLSHTISHIYNQNKI